MIRFLFRSILASVALTALCFYLLLTYLQILSQDQHAQSEVQEDLESIQDQDMVLHFINLDQGKPILIQTGHQGTLLDVGHKTDADSLLDYLVEMEVNTISDIFLTNALAENTSGIGRIIDQFPAANVHIPKMTVMNYDMPRDLNYQTIEAGDKVTLDSKYSLQLEMIAPSFTAFGDAFNDSMVSLLHYRDLRILFTSDIREEAELKLLQQNPGIRAEIMTVPDRPSGVNQSTQFIDNVNPQTAVMLRIPCNCDDIIDHAQRRYSLEWSDFFYVPIGKNLRIYFKDGSYITPKNQLK